MSWQKIRGRETLIQGFSQVVRRGRLAHAYLFTGPAGVGKRLFAKELAKALLCETDSGGRLEACDHCPACIQVEADSHPDFFAVGRPEDKNEIPIDVMRELCRGFSLKSARGRGKVAILDDADDLNDESANCFLKTLEEPPPRSVFLLIGTSAERQLATVVSRCQVVRFAPLAKPVVANILRDQGLGDSPLLDRLIRLSGGSPGRALALADPALWDFRKQFLQGLTRSQADTVGLARSWMEFVQEAGKDGAAQRRRASILLRFLIDFLDDALALRLESSPKSDDPDDLPLLRSFASRHDVETLLKMLDRCLDAEFHLDRYVQLVLACEALLDALGQELVVAV